MERSKEMGWFEMTYISMDERGMEQLRPAVELIESITDENGESFKISSAFNYSSQSDYSFTDQIDEILINFGYVSDTSEKMRDMAAHRRALGLTTTIYTCTGNYPGNFTISDPEDINWVMWYTLAHDTGGFMRWAWDNWVKEPLTNVTYKWWEPGDGWFVFPVEKDAAEDSDYFYSTPRYEMLKKGVRDINKAKYLMTLDEELEAEIKELVKSLQQPNTGSSYGSVVLAGEADRELVFSETARMREGVMEISRKYIEDNKEPDVIGNPFEDVAETDFFYDAVLWAVANQITDGLTETAFAPDMECTRGQVVTFLWRTQSCPKANTEAEFTDVAVDAYYAEAVAWAVEEGITDGWTETQFAPDMGCSRGQIVTFLYRAQQ